MNKPTLALEDIAVRFRLKDGSIYEKFYKGFVCIDISRLQCDAQLAEMRYYDKTGEVSGVDRSTIPLHEKAVSGREQLSRELSQKFLPTEGNNLLAVSEISRVEIFPKTREVEAVVRYPFATQPEPIQSRSVEVPIETYNSDETWGGIQWILAAAVLAVFITAACLI